MEETQSSFYAVIQRDHDEFRYYLSAFLAAARSITLFMQVEFKHVLDFDNWYDTEKGKMEQNETMRFLLEQRNITIHHKGHKTLQPHRIIHTIIVEHNLITESVITFSFPADATEEEMEKCRLAKLAAIPPEPEPLITNSESKTEQTWYFNELKQKGLQSDVIPVCKVHIAKLERLVDDCEQKFTL